MTLPAHIDNAIRQIGVVPAKVPPKPPQPRDPTPEWYRDGEVPF